MKKYKYVVAHGGGKFGYKVEKIEDYTPYGVMSRFCDRRLTVDEIKAMDKKKRY